MTDCIFCKIVNKEIPTKFAYEDEEIVVFSDIHPVRPVHLLIVSKKHIEDFLDIDDITLLNKIHKVVQKMVKENNLENRGYRLMVNGAGAQAIPHFHLHLTGPMGKSAKM